MSKKKINKTKLKQKQKQKQKQTQIVNVNIHKPTRKRTTQQPTQRNVQQLPTPQYIYTSQTDNLVPQIFNKQGQQETLAEQINKTLDEKINTLVSQYTSKPKIPQPTQQEIRETRTTQYNKPDIKKAISEYGKNKPKQEAPKIFNNEPQPPLSNIQQDQPDEKATPKYFKLNEPDTLYVTNTPANTPARVVGFEQGPGFYKRAPPERSMSVSSIVNKERYTTPTREEIRNLRIPPILKSPGENIGENPPRLTITPKSSEKKASTIDIKNLSSQELIDYKKKLKIEKIEHEKKYKDPDLNKQAKGHITRLINANEEKLKKINEEINLRPDIIKKEKK